MQTRLLETDHGTLAVRSYGTGPAVVALHGFTHTGAQFADLADLCSETLIAPDLPGHGRTTIHPVDYQTTIAALGMLLDELGPVPVVGYSQGARIALWLALQWPGSLTELALISASPGAGDGPARRAADHALAARIERDGLEPFLDEWLDSALTGTKHLPAETRRADRAVRMENDATGLAAALRGLGQGVRPSVDERLAEISVPVTFLAGERDRRYAELAVTMAGAVAKGRAIVVPDAGHNLLLDSPETGAAAIDAIRRQPA